MHVEQKYPYKKIEEYPHFGVRDKDIWERYIDANPDRFDQVWYDFRVGDGAHDCAGCSECNAVGWYDLTRWRIDVIGADETAIYVIEIRPAANARALGSAMSYAMLYKQEHQPELPVIPVVLTDHIISTTQKIANYFGVEMWVG